MEQDECKSTNKNLLRYKCKSVVSICNYMSIRYRDMFGLEDCCRCV